MTQINRESVLKLLRDLAAKHEPSASLALATIRAEDLGALLTGDASDSEGAHSWGNLDDIVKIAPAVFAMLKFINDEVGRRRARAEEEARARRADELLELWRTGLRKRLKEAGVPEDKIDEIVVEYAGRVESVLVQER